VFSPSCRGAVALGVPSGRSRPTDGWKVVVDHAPLAFPVVPKNLMRHGSVWIATVPNKHPAFVHSATLTAAYKYTKHQLQALEVGDEWSAAGQRYLSTSARPTVLNGRYMGTVRQVLASAVRDQLAPASVIALAGLGCTPLDRSVGSASAVFKLRPCLSPLTPPTSMDRPHLASAKAVLRRSDWEGKTLSSSTSKQGRSHNRSPLLILLDPCSSPDAPSRSRQPDHFHHAAGYLWMGRSQARLL